MNCRHCNTPLKNLFVDLYNSPPSNSFLKKEKLLEVEYYFPLKIFTCDHCFLVQIAEYKKATEIFSDEYVYFSSFSTSWVAHAKNYVEMMVDRFKFNENSFVVEIASNDGYLLQFFKEKGVPNLGIEPTVNTADAARAKGIESINEFFGSNFAHEKLATKGKSADLIIGNNVLAHVPDINDFVKGLKIALKPQGVITLEFPHLLKLVEENQFDTIYHEHFSYLSFHVVNRIFKSQGLKIFDVDELKTHGGSLRIYATHVENNSLTELGGVKTLLDKEEKAGMLKMDYYQGFQPKVEKIKLDVLKFLIDSAGAGKKVIAYGAAAKGNTLLNYCGVKADLITYCADASTHKQGLYLPGSHIPVISPDEIVNLKPDFLLILPWNLKEEITKQFSFIKSWGGKFVVPIPELTIF